jgi:ABC-type tungstate transport system permease subunit
MLAMAPVNPAKHPNVKAKEGQAFIDWLTGPEGQTAIADYRSMAPVDAALVTSAHV